MVRGGFPKPEYTKAFRPVSGSLHPLPLHTLPLHPLPLQPLPLHPLSLHPLPLHPLPFHPFHRVDQTILGATCMCDAVFLFFPSTSWMTPMLCLILGLIEWRIRKLDYCN